MIYRRLAKIRLSQVSSANSQQSKLSVPPHTKVLSPTSLREFMNLDVTPPSPSQGLLPPDPPRPRERSAADHSPPADKSASMLVRRSSKNQLASVPSLPPSKRPYSFEGILPDSSTITPQMDHCLSNPYSVFISLF